MTTRRGRRLTTCLWMPCLLCLLLLAHAPVSWGQKLKAADVSALVRDLKDDDAKVRFAAARRLLSAGAEARAAVSVLLELVKGADKELRLQVFDLIENIGPEARDAVPILAEALKDEASIVRFAAFKALGGIGRDKSDGAALARELKDKDPQMRALAACRLAAMRDVERAAAPDTGGGTFHVEFDGVDVTGPLTIPYTGGWNTFQTVTKTGVSLTAGPKVMRIVVDSNSPGGGEAGSFNTVRIQ